MRVIGIDPGLACTGYAVLQVRGRSIVVLEVGVVKTKASQKMPERLKIIYDGISEVIAIHKPEAMSIETVFAGKNIQSTIKLGHARAASILAAGNAGLEVSEHSPKEVKQNITGTGNATKIQVQYMVKNILRLESIPKPADAADAVAICLSHIQKIKFANRLG